ncbi:MerR family transcriptional regulator [Domibacillus indicus]|uniref:MerR family transcriptional regulator n=1 Tax=Domibacillus indicus TaxID=1437523 RepID=UPI002042262E|nr:MerR family transcriptional regulator [Domibacillus indicus]MCM3790183.1 MerR family transcriptional regulator [Domibacillus indicus]
MYTVKEAARLLDLTEHSVRYYTDKGLVPSVQRDKNNIRLFDDESINWLRGVKNLRQAGMSVEAVKAYIDLCLEGDATIPQRYEIILEQKAVALAQLEEAKRIAKFMEDKASHYLDIINQVASDDMNPGKWTKNKNHIPHETLHS